VPLPDTPSTSVSRETQEPRPPDQATTSALRGDQPAGQGSSLPGAGNTQATSLSASASWSVSAYTGTFSWSYPFRVPPVPGGLEPKLALSYASSAVDGRTSSTNNQASWVGDGWDLTPGFVERTYGSCADDANHSGKKTQRQRQRLLQRLGRPADPGRRERGVATQGRRRLAGGEAARRGQRRAGR
jgi:hypothetical protein